MSDDASSGEYLRARTLDSYLVALIIPRRKRRLKLIDTTGGQWWTLSRCGLEYWVMLLLIPGDSPRWFFAYSTLDGYRVPPECPRGTQLCELTAEEALLLCKEEGAKAPHKLIEAYKASESRPDATPQPEAAAGPLAAPMPGPEPRSTPQPGSAADPAPMKPAEIKPTKQFKEPSARAFAAYRASKLGGKKQEDLVPMFGVTQGTISRWLQDVGRWIEAGNVLPEEMRVEPSRRKPDTMDPRKLEQGPQRRGRA